MTIEEAIAIIRKEYLCVDRDCDIERSCGKCDLVMPSKEPILEAYKMAIKALEQEPCEDCVSRHAVNVLVDELARAISDERCFLSRGRSTASIMQDILDLPSVTPQSKIVETGWRELFLLDGMSQFIKKEMGELLKSPWAQDKTLTPHDMAVKEAFATVKDLILSKFEIKEGWENLIH